MDATVLAGWVGGGAGLLGALFGAGATLAATRMTQRHAAEEAQIAREHEVADAKEQRLFELARGALDATLTELDSLSRATDPRRYSTPPQERAWERPVEEHLQRIEGLLHRIPNVEARERLQRVVYVAGQYHLAGSGYLHELSWLFVATREAIRCTSAHLHEEDLPQPLGTFAANDETVTEDDDMYIETMNEARRNQG